MHAASFIALLLLATSAWAITVTQPSQGTTWDSSGTNTIAWIEVNTDPTSFAATLVQHGVFQKTLVDSIDGTKGSVSVSMTGLPTGIGFQVNLVKSSQDPNTILAQSSQFNITAGAGSSSSVAASTGSGTSSSRVGTSSNGATSAGSASSSIAPSGSLNTALPNVSSTSVNPTASHSSAASLSASTHGGVMGILALFGLALVY